MNLFRNRCTIHILITHRIKEQINLFFRGKLSLDDGLTYLEKNDARFRKKETNR